MHHKKRRTIDGHFHTFNYRSVLSEQVINLVIFVLLCSRLYGIGIPMNWEAIYQHMAFCPYKEELGRQQEIKHALTTLYDSTQGRAKAYEVADAAKQLRRYYGRGVAMGCHDILHATKIEDEGPRNQIVYEGIDLIERYLRR
jgi:hypothetical protein